MARPPTKHQCDQAEQAGAAHHPHRDPVTKIAQRLDARVGALELYGENFLVAYQKHPEHRHQREYRDQRDDGGGKSGLTEFADQLGIRNCRAINEMPAVPWVSTQAGPDHEHGVPERGVFVLTGDQTVARRKVSCIESEKLITMISGSHHIQKHIEVEIGPSKAAEREQDRDHRRESGDHHERYLAEENDRDDTSRQNTEDIVGQPRRA